jgi:hypothetical protein
MTQKAKSKLQKPIQLHPVKYDLYQKSVQAPESDAAFFRDITKKATGKTPKIFGEDFCGTFANSCAWVKLGPEYKSVGIDFDDEPIDYGMIHNYSQLTPKAQQRVSVQKKNVLDKKLPKADLICALNFSYFIFKQRSMLVQYFKNVHSRLNPKGAFVLDCFGGPQCQEPIRERRHIEDGDFYYYWDQENFDYVNNEAKFNIHFKLKGKPIQEKVFSYDWRLWSIAELRDVLMDAGFKKVDILVEDSDEDGDGNGEFSNVQGSDELCESWIAYILASK